MVRKIRSFIISLAVFILIHIYLLKNNLTIQKLHFPSNSQTSHHHDEHLQQQSKDILKVLTATAVHPQVTTTNKIARSMCVIAPIFNPASYKSRYALYRKFEKHIQSFGVQLITVECAVGDQEFQVTDANNPNHIQFKTDDVLWYKENLINIGVRRSPAECEYIAWIDLEVEFLDKNWVFDAIRALQQFKIIQLFDVIRILGPKSEIIEARYGYAKCFPKKKDDEQFQILYKQLDLPWVIGEKHFCATGFAFAATKKTLMDIGGLFDKGIAGSGDSINIFGFMNEIRALNRTVPFIDDFLDEILAWQDRVYPYMNGSIGYLNSSVNHLWHGSMKDRAYVSRNAIVNSREYPYKPLEHLYYDEQGLLHFKPEPKKFFKNRLLEYFMSRNEDLEDTEGLDKKK